MTWIALGAGALIGWGMAVLAHRIEKKRPRFGAWHYLAVTAFCVALTALDLAQHSYWFIFTGAAALICGRNAWDRRKILMAKRAAS